MVSQELCLMASEITQWTERHSVQLVAMCISGRKNILGDQLGRPNQVLLRNGPFCHGCSRGSAASLAIPCRPICHSSKHEASAVSVSSSRSPSVEAGCSSTPMGESVHICLPSVCAAQTSSLMSAGLDDSLVNSHGSTVALGVVRRPSIPSWH